MKVTVTGGAGFIGSHLATLLVDQGHDVTVLDNLDPRVHGGDPQVSSRATLIRADVRDPKAVAEGVVDTEVVFHEAAMVGLGRGADDAVDYADVNVVGTAVLLQGMRKHAPGARLVLGSTMALYGEGAYRCGPCGAPREGVRVAADLAAGRWEPRCATCDADLVPVAIDEGHPPRPGTTYAATKLGQEALTFAAGRGSGIPVVALRYHNVYGARMPRDTPYAGVASLFKSRLLRGEPPIVHEDGRQLRDFVHVEDVARANLLAAVAPEGAVAGEAFNVASGSPKPVLEFARTLAEAIDPSLLPKLSGTWRAGDARHVFASTAKAERVLGFRARVRFEDGLRRFATDPAREAPRTVPT